MKKVKWGVWGSGGIARRRTIPEGILPASNAELVAVCSATAASTELDAGTFGVEGCVTGDQLLAGDCECVYIATPVHLHCEQIVRAAEAGKHVLCEKPVAMTFSEVDRAIAACRAHQVTFGVAFMMRFLAQHQEALRLVQEDKLGAPVFVRAQLSCWYPPMAGAWRQDPATSGGGTLMDLAVHALDLVEMFFGKVARLTCFTGNLVQPYRSEDSSVVLLEFENGAKGVVDTFFNIPDAASKNRLELYGSRGSILAEGTIGQGEAGSMTAYLDDIGRGYEAQQRREPGAGVKIAPPRVNMYRAEIEAFSQAVLDGAEFPIGAEAALRSQRILDACYESASEGIVLPV